MLVYFLVDIFVLLMLIVGEVNNRYLKNISKITIIMVFFIFTGLSYKIHNDMYLYEMLFNTVHFSDIGNIIMEPGFVFLNSVANAIFSFHVFKALIYFLFTIILYKSLKEFSLREDEIVFVFALLFLIPMFYLLSFSAFRQFIAIGIFFYALKYLLYGQNIKYFLFILLASLFHISAIILFLLPFLFKYYKKDFYRDIILVTGSFILANTPILNSLIHKIVLLLLPSIPRLSTYADSMVNNGLHISLFNMAILFLSYVTVFIYNKKRFYTNIDNFIYKGSMVFFILFFIGLKLNIFYRIELYFYIFLALNITFLLRNFKKNNAYYLLKYFIILLLITQDIKHIASKYHEDESLIPYHSYIETFFYNIPYNKTAQYNHMYNKWGRVDLKYLPVLKKEK